MEFCNHIYVYAGTVMSGVLEQPIPRNIVYGKTVQTALQLMLASQGYLISIDYVLGIHVSLLSCIPTTSQHVSHKV